MYSNKYFLLLLVWILSWFWFWVLFIDQVRRCSCQCSHRRGSSFGLSSHVCRQTTEGSYVLAVTCHRQDWKAEVIAIRMYFCMGIWACWWYWYSSRLFHLSESRIMGQAELCAVIRWEAILLMMNKRFLSQYPLHPCLMLSILWVWPSNPILWWSKYCIVKTIGSRGH